MKKIIYIDMDGTVVDFKSGIDELTEIERKQYEGNEEGSIFWKRLILSHHKNLNKGAYLIDDHPDRNGADKFQGKLIHFASEEYPDWESIENYFLTTVKEQHT